MSPHFPTRNAHARNAHARNIHARNIHVRNIVLGLVLALTGCGGGDGGFPLDPGDKVGTCGSSGGPVITISGQILYQRLVLTVSGLGPGTETRPVRYADVEIRSAGGGTCFGRGQTDGGGNYLLVVNPPATATLEVVVLSRTLQDPTRDIFVHEASPPFTNTHSETNVFSHASAPFAAATAVVGFTVPYTPGPANRPGIGFGLLDTVVDCWNGTAAAGLAIPERAHLYTRLGNNGVLGTSFYSHGTRAIAILGGAAGAPDDSDTDYFDDAVVAHEFSHFVDKVVSHSMSRGGGHNGATPIEPNFSWSEGSATGFGCLLIGTPLYIDTITTDSTFQPNLYFLGNIENIGSGIDPPGIGGEFGMAEILWDLGDDAVAAGDADADGVSVTLAQLYAALTSFSASTDGPYIGLFLTRLVGLSPLTDGQVANFLTNGPEDQGISHPPAGNDVWPKPIAIGGSGSGTLTSIGGNPSRQLAASDWYQFTLAAPAVVSIDLTVIGTGGPGDDLNLYLTRNEDVNLNLASSTNIGGADESINASLAAGTYIIRVEANPSGSHDADYLLDLD